MCRYMQWCQTVLALGVRACTLRQQDLGDWHVAVLGCNVQWSEAFLLCTTINRFTAITTSNYYY